MNARGRIVPWLRGALVASVAALGLFVSCAEWPLTDLDDVCRIYRDRSGWQAAAQASGERWEVSEAFLMAVLYQESRFRATARPDLRWFLFVPVGRKSSAYGYGQVKDGTWNDYRERTGRADARRDDFDDAIDFVGWYMDVIHRATGIAKTDPYNLYLAYHEGPAGWRRGSYREKPWLEGVARKVQAHADLYDAQLRQCPGASPRRAEAG